MSSTEIRATDVKALRDQTGAGMMDCKAALQESGGDFDRAVEILRVKGQAQAAKRSGRVASEGAVASYIHSTGKIGVLVEVNSETDFVARNDDFQAFVRDVALHIAAANPQVVSEDEVPEDVKAAETHIYEEQAADKPEQARPKIVEGRWRKWLEENVLLNQTHVNSDKHEGKTIEQLRAGDRQQDRRERRDPALHALRRGRGVTSSCAEDGRPAFRRILLKLSGEALTGHARVRRRPGPDRRHRRRRSSSVVDRGVEVAIVVGGGNIYRGLEGAAQGMDRATGDYMGMLATVLNALALQDALEKRGVAHARAVGDHDLRGGRAVHPAARDAPPREGPHRDLRGRHRQPVLHHRHGRGPARARDPCRSRC